MTESRFDIIVIGGGPAGQKAAIQGAKVRRRVLIIERDEIGGACVHHGTIPSKTIREAAVALTGFHRRTAGVFHVQVREDLQLQSLLLRVRQVVGGNSRTMDDQLRRNGVERWHGRARFLSPHTVAVQDVHGAERTASAEVIVIAAGSRPRNPPEVPIDHEHILDSDSILSMLYLPATLTVLGSGVIACEYASLFQALGVRVTLIDRSARPLAFLDPELSAEFLRAFTLAGGQFLGERAVRGVVWDGLTHTRVTTDRGEEVRSEKLLCALGRVANLDGLDIDEAGLTLSPRGYLAVDAYCRTAVGHIYAAGDAIGPPALASAAMEQGRRAVCHALGLPLGVGPDMIPIGIYTIPEMSSVGLSEAQAVERHGGAVVGRAPFHELARGQIAAIEDGLLKLVADRDGRRLLGVQIVGEGASELIHVGQMALLHGMEVDGFVENIFNFPTLAEAYRVAALDIARKRGL
jgi:NAD(P) transhydrogenase